MRLGHVLCLIATAVLPSNCESVQLNCSSSEPAVSVTVRSTSSAGRPGPCCMLRTGNESEAQRPCAVLLQLKTSPAALHFRQVLQAEDSDSSLDVVTCQGSDVELLCNGSSYPLQRVGWRGPSQLFSSGPSLFLTDIRRDDAGIYSCHQGEQLLARNVNLIVEFAPIISVTEEEVRGTEDKDCVLECLVEALPVARVTWFKDDVPVGQLGRFRALSEPRQNCTLWAGLLVKAVDNNRTEGDDQPEGGFGNYTCTAENKHGRTSAYLRLVADAGHLEQVGERRFNMTGFIIGMCPPMFISFYIILKLGYRSRYAEERGEEDGTREERFFVSH